MTPLIVTLIVLDVAVFLFMVVLVARAVWADWKHRGEDDGPEFGEHADQAMGLIDAQVPQGTGEALAREIQDYFKEIQR